MVRPLTDRFKNLSPAVSLALKILGLAAALITIGTALGEWTGVGSILSKSVRDSLSDFLTADLEVWHLLLAVGLELVVGVVIIVAWRMRGITPAEVDVGTSGIVPYPNEVKHFGVIWPIHTVIVGGTTPQFHAGKPACLKDRTTLGRIRMTWEELEVGDRVLETLDDMWEELEAGEMKFGCFKDDAIYDLTGYQCGMEEALRIVVGQAEGQYMTALARVRGEADH